MLGRKTFTQDELDHGRALVGEQLAAYDTLVQATADTAAREAFEPLFFNNLTLALDRCFVHRLRSVTGKDSNALNEVELIVESLLNNDGVLRGNNVIKYVPAQTAAKLEIGDTIRLRAEQFERLSAAFLAEIESRFVG